MFPSIKTEDCLSKNPVTFSKDTNIFDAIHILLERKVSGGTVVDEDNHVMGVISDKDCLKAILNRSYYSEVGGTVNDFMTTDVIYADLSLNIVDMGEILLKNNKRRMPVVINGKFAGQISVRSILQAVKDFRFEHDKTEDSIYE